MPQAKIHFIGLCLFAKSKGTGHVEVYLADPAHHVHVKLLREKNSPTTYGSSRIGPKEALLLGPDSAGAVAMPPDSALGNLATLPGVPATNRIHPPAGSHDPRGPRVHLRGGTLRVVQAGAFMAVGPDGTTKDCTFSNVVTWEGDVDDGQLTGEHEIWNAPADEAPTVDPNHSVPSQTKLTNAEQRWRALEHFQVYFELLGIQDPPIVIVKGLPTFTALDPGYRSLTVSSCPSAQITVDP